MMSTKSKTLFKISMYVFWCKSCNLAIEKRLNSKRRTNWFRISWNAIYAKTLYAFTVRFFSSSFLCFVHTKLSSTNTSSKQCSYVLLAFHHFICINMFLAWSAFSSFFGWSCVYFYYHFSQIKMKITVFVAIFSVLCNLTWWGGFQFTDQFKVNRQRFWTHLSAIIGAANFDDQHLIEKEFNILFIVYYTVYIVKILSQNGIVWCFDRSLNSNWN